MMLLDKLNLQTVSRQIEHDPVAERRARFCAGSAEQRLVLAAPRQPRLFDAYEAPRTDADARQPALIEAD